jgi:hypothetical protein
MLSMLPFLKDIRRLKLEMFGNENFFLTRGSTIKQQNGFRFSTKKTLFQNLNENESCIWTPKRKVSRQFLRI